SPPGAPASSHALESLPASSSTTVRPSSASRAASVPPPAPEPTTTYSASACCGVGTAEISPLARLLERLHELDERPLVGVAQARLFLEAAGAEVVAAVHHEVRAVAEAQQRLDQVL